jgi:hypothetical protein
MQLHDICVELTIEHRYKQRYEDEIKQKCIYRPNNTSAHRAEEHLKAEQCICTPSRRASKGRTMHLHTEQCGAQSREHVPRWLHAMYSAAAPKVVCECPLHAPFCNACRNTSFACLGIACSKGGVREREREKMRGAMQCQPTH